MQNWLRQLERRFAPLAVPHLAPAIVIGQVAVYGLAYLQQARGAAGVDILGMVQLRPDLILQGEVWRVVTFLFEPPNYELLWLFFHWYAMWFIGRSLERLWGAFRLTLYLLIGYAATVGVSFFLPPGMASNTYLYTSLFLAFARVYPDFSFYIYLLIPVKSKWLAAFTWGFFAVSIVTGGWPQFLLVSATVADYLLFFGYDLVRQIKDTKRKQDFRVKADRGSKAVVHECRVCGVTSQMEPRMSFRYCSACAGQQCYCPEHLKDHEHVVDGG